VVFVLAAGLMLGVNALDHAAADSLLNIYGTAPVDIPVAPAIIAAPKDGSSVALPYTLVAGSCPLVSPQVVVAVDVDGVRAGSAICNPDNDFSMPLALGSGSHSLTAQVYTITGEMGATSSPVHITYRAPTSLAAAQPGDAGAAGPLKLAADSPFLYLGASRTVTWAGTLAGDTQPHHILVDWGDKTQDEYTVQPGALHFTHHYRTLQSYDVTIFVSSASGTAVRAQYAVAAYTSVPVGAGSTNSAEPAAPRAFGDTPTILGLYGLFLSVSAICAIIWLEAKHHARHAEETLVFHLSGRQA
jgi:hypothetical protein